MIKNCPKEITRHIKKKSCQKIDLGMSGASVFLCDDVVLKIDQNGFEMRHEIDVLKKISHFGITPGLIESFESNQKIYAVTKRLKGYDLSQDFHIKEPLRLIDYLVQGLKELWKIHITDLDIRYTLEDKLREARAHVEKNMVDESDFDGDILKDRFKNSKEILKFLIHHKPDINDLVLSHGDYCLPNIFADEKDFIGFVDLGRVGIDSKHQDIALCQRSILYNLKDQRYVDLFYEKLGIPINPSLIDYYLLLDELF